MATLTELLAKKAELDAKIEEIRQSELDDAIAKVRELIADFDLAVTDVFPRGKATKKGKRGRPAKAGKAAKKAKGQAKKVKARRKRGKVAPKYRDPQTGATWTGRGRTPRWLDGKKPEDFLI